MVDLVVIAIVIAVCVLIIRGMLRGTITSCGDSCNGNCASCGNICATPRITLSDEQKAQLEALKNRKTS